MREILFRGKRLDNGEWVEGSLIALDYEWVYIVPPHVGASTMSKLQLIALGMKRVDPATVGQYTGLTDKNGVKIFEGDIVTFEDTVNDFEGYHDSIYINRGVVSIYPNGVSFSNREVVDMDDLYNTDDSIEAEVIGSVHDNPELLNDN